MVAYTAPLLLWDICREVFSGMAPQIKARFQNRAVRSCLLQSTTSNHHVGKAPEQGCYKCEKRKQKMENKNKIRASEMESCPAKCGASFLHALIPTSVFNRSLQWKLPKFCLKVQILYSQETKLRNKIPAGNASFFFSPPLTSLGIVHFKSKQTSVAWCRKKRDFKQRVMWVLPLPGQACFQFAPVKGIWNEAKFYKQ